MRLSQKPHATVQQLLARWVADPSSACRMPLDELDLTLRIARRARVLAYGAHRLQGQEAKCHLPAAAAQQLQSALIDAEARERLLRWELNRVARALEPSAANPVVVLKGAAYLLAGLPNSAGRLCADLDLLVPRHHLPATEARLFAHGWQFSKLSAYDERYYRVWAHELPPLRHPERELETDLHHNILQPTARLKPSPPLLLEQIRPIPDSPLFVLAPADMVLHAMTHLFFDGDMADALRDLLDIDTMLRHFSRQESDFWERFWPRAEQLDLERPAFYGLRYASRWLGTPVPNAVLDASLRGAPPRPIRHLMDVLVPQALFPQHPERPTRSAALFRLLLYVRSHWIRMPPLLLARHLTFKFYMRHIRDRLRRRPARPESQAST